MEEFELHAPENDAEAQAALVVAQLARRRPTTFAHSVRVARLAVDVARTIRLPELQVRQVYWGGLLHDVGELHVSAAIIDKPGPLTAAERAALAEHTTVGARWLSAVPGASSLVPFARWHHERFDGTGYPDGRGARDVPMTVALVGVCDAWDALTEARPYRAPLTFGDAVDEMQRHAGRQWSRAIVGWLLDTVMVPSARVAGE